MLPHKTLITGGAGFIGGHLIEALLSVGHEVLVIDNFFAGRRENIPGGTALVEFDLGRADENDIFRTVHRFSPDTIVHLAAIHYIPFCLAYPGRTFESNVRSTEVLIRALAAGSTRNLIIASTADIYANTDCPHRETDQPTPSNPYGLSKLLSEQILEYAVRINPGLSGTALRLFNVYGTRETNSHVIPRIVELIKDKSLKQLRMGYLGGTRDFVHVADVVRAIVAALRCTEPGFRVFNVGTGKPTSVREVLRLLKREAGDAREVVEDVMLYRTFDRQSLTADISKIAAELNWMPTRRLEDSLAELLLEQTHAVVSARF